MSLRCRRSGITSERLCEYYHSKYGVDVADGPLQGLTARAVVVLDENNRVLHSELVPEIANEPNYDAALAALK